MKLMVVTLANNTLLTGKIFTNSEDDTSMCIPLPFFHAFAGVLGNISMTAVPFKSGNNLWLGSNKMD